MFAEKYFDAIYRNEKYISFQGQYFVTSCRYDDV